MQTIELTIINTKEYYNILIETFCTGLKKEIELIYSQKLIPNSLYFKLQFNLISDFMQLTFLSEISKFELKYTKEQLTECYFKYANFDLN